MQACGVIVEYNPFHNGHLYHIKKSKEHSKADCMIAVMSGSFLQRGEPAIIDKFMRTESALKSGVDIVLELPYPYAVQSSKYFAMGAIRTLNACHVSSICFGSEHGSIDDFYTSYHIHKRHEHAYQKVLKQYLAQGNSFPKASELAYKAIGLSKKGINLTKPNNILGYSYVSQVLKEGLEIDLLTIKRKGSEYHDETIGPSIASATSLRSELLKKNKITKRIANAMPKNSLNALESYHDQAKVWHHWELYFPFIHYRVLTMSPDELRQIHTVDEGLEYRLIDTAKQATSFNHWMQLLKTKRYTWTRLQRMFVHILTNTTKQMIQQILSANNIPYMRLLGLNKVGQKYLNQIKKKLDVPLINQMGRNDHPCLQLEEKASYTYYSVLPANIQTSLRRQELQPPIFV